MECITCPSTRPFSHKGTSSLEQCMTLHGNLYVSNQINRITQFSPDANTHTIFVDKDGMLDEPWDMTFLNNGLMLVCNHYSSSVELYGTDSEHKSRFIEVDTPIGILMFPNSENKVAVASYTDSVVYVYDLTGSVEQNINGTVTINRRTDRHIIFTTQPLSSSDGGPYYLTFGSDMSEVLITSHVGKVVRRCISAECASDRNKVMVYSGNDDSDLNGIISIPSNGEYLVADRWGTVYRCSLTAPTNQLLQDCEVFTSDMYDP